MKDHLRKYQYYYFFLSDKISISICIEMLKQQHQDISCANNCQSDLFVSFVSGLDPVDNFREKFKVGFWGVFSHQEVQDFKTFVQVILFEIDCSIFCTNLYELLCQFIG